MIVMFKCKFLNHFSAIVKILKSQLEWNTKDTEQHSLMQTIIYSAKFIIKHTQGIGYVYTLDMLHCHIVTNKKDKQEPRWIFCQNCLKYRNSERHSSHFSFNRFPNNPKDDFNDDVESFYHQNRLRLFNLLIISTFANW